LYKFTVKQIKEYMKRSGYSSYKNIGENI